MKALSISLPFILSLIGGIFFGLFTYGGYVWHHTLFDWIVIFSFLPFLFSVIYSLRNHFTVNRAFQYSAALLLLFVCSVIFYELVRSATTPFYPATPDTIAAWFNQFTAELLYTFT